MEVKAKSSVEERAEVLASSVFKNGGRAFGFEFDKTITRRDYLGFMPPKEGSFSKGAEESWEKIVAAVPEDFVEMVKKMKDYKMKLFVLTFSDERTKNDFEKQKAFAQQYIAWLRFHYPKDSEKPEFLSSALPAHVMMQGAVVGAPLVNAVLKSKNIRPDIIMAFDPA